MSDSRKYYYLKLKENYFDDDSIVLLESMQDGILYSYILLKLYLKSLKNGGKLQLDENIPYTPQMIATLTRQQVGTVERALKIYLQLGLLPIPFMVATKFLRILKSHPSRMFRADAKAQVSYDYDTGRITTFLCSVQHSPDVEVSDFRHILESVMVLAASEYALNTDFQKLINPTGRFVIGGSFADCGVTGRKLACDTYGGIGRIGGGAMSGKDPSKVDRSGAYMARKIARDIVLSGYADKCEIQIAYAIGMPLPVSVNIDCFGTENQNPRFIEQFVKENYDLTPKGMSEFLGLTDVDYNLVSSYGHFGKQGLPWEK